MSEAVSADASPVEKQNHFDCFFDPMTPNTSLLNLPEHYVRRVLRSVNPNKAAEPDRVLGKVLKACADRLSVVLRRIFNIYIKQAIVLPCLKAASPLSPMSCLRG